MTALTPIAVAGVFAGLYLHHSLLHSMIQENSRQTDIPYELMAAKAIGQDGENNDNIVKEEDFFETIEVLQIKTSFIWLQLQIRLLLIVAVYILQT